MILKNCRFIVTQDDERKILENVDLKINDEKKVIEEIGVEVTRESSEEIIDCSKHVVIPGIINPHIHLFTVSLRNMNIIDWQDLWRKARNLTGQLNVLKESWKKGLNMVSLTGTTLVAPTEIHYEEFVNCINTFIDIAGGPFLFEAPEKILGKIVHVSSLLDVNPEEFKEIVDEAYRRNIDVSIHISNTRDEVFGFKKKYGKFPIEYLDYIGALRENIILTGLEWITSWELNVVANYGCKVILIPSCSMFYTLGGLPPITEFMKRNISLGIGTCSLTCSNGFLLHEAKMLLYYIRSSYWSLRTTAQQVFDILTLGNASILKAEHGRITEGGKANLALLNIEHVKFYPLSKEKVVQNIILNSEINDIEYLIVKGKKHVKHQHL